MKKIVLYIAVFLFFTGCFLHPCNVSAYQSRVVYLEQGDVQIKNPEIAQKFYDNLKGKPRDYFIDSAKNFNLYINLLVPEEANKDGRYSADIFDNQGNKIYSIDGDSSDWQEFYQSFDRNYYLKGPELSEQLLAGKYKIEVYSNLPSQAGDNSSSQILQSKTSEDKGEYVLVVGKKESYDILSVFNLYWQLPFLKITFFKTSVLQFFLTPFGIAGIGLFGAILIFLALISYLTGLIKKIIKHNEAKTLLLTSNGMQMKNEIIKLLQKPTYDITVAFITTAAKPVENTDYLKRDLEIMRDELRFNVEEIDIEGKKESEVMKLLELKDIIFVEGGNTFYLLKAMRECHFEKVIRKLLKQGKVYIGASAGSVVAGRTIKTSYWKHPEKNMVRLKNLRGLNLVPFDIFAHYQPEYSELIKQEIKDPKKRAKNLRILTDEQAILVQGKEVDLIGKGEQIIV